MQWLIATAPAVLAGIEWAIWLYPRRDQQVTRKKQIPVTIILVITMVVTTLWFFWVNPLDPHFTSLELELGEREGAAMILLSTKFVFAMLATTSVAVLMGIAVMGALHARRAR